jgi:hypothetical protein
MTARILNGKAITARIKVEPKAEVTQPRQHGASRTNGMKPAPTDQHLKVEVLACILPISLQRRK